MSDSVDPDETAHMSRLIWIYAVGKSLLLSPMAVKELRSAITSFRHISIIPQPSEPRCLSIFLLSSEPGHSISYTVACAFTEDTNQPAHPRSRLIKSLQGTLGVAKDPKRLRADGKDSNQHARMHRLI